MNEEGVDGLLKWWDDQPRKRQNDLYVKVGLIRRLIDSDDHETAYKLILEALKRWTTTAHWYNNFARKLLVFNQ